MLFVWEGIRVSGGNQHIRVNRHKTISHVNGWYQSWVTVVRGEHVTNAPVGQPVINCSI